MCLVYLLCVCLVCVCVCTRARVCICIHSYTLRRLSHLPPLLLRPLPLYMVWFRARHWQQETNFPYGYQSMHARSGAAKGKRESGESVIGALIFIICKGSQCINNNNCDCCCYSTCILLANMYDTTRVCPVLCHVGGSRLTDHFAQVYLLIHFPPFTCGQTDSVLVPYIQ